MGKTKSRANGDGDVFPRKNTAGKITSYRGAYVGPDGKRRYVSGKTKEEARRNLRRARGDAERGLVFDADNLKVGEYMARWLSDAVQGTVRRTTFARFVTALSVKPPAIVIALCSVRSFSYGYSPGFFTSPLT